MSIYAWRYYDKGIYAGILRHGQGLLDLQEPVSLLNLLLQTGDDFWFQDLNGDPLGVYWLQGVHMIHCAYNSLWMGQMIQPDWDMFQSDHCCAKYHAASRSICGGPVYLSDSVGFHDFDLIGQLVLPDGTIPKCIHFALPTRDCLFKNPLFDGETVLKIWNLNKVFYSMLWCSLQCLRLI